MTKMTISKKVEAEIEALRTMDIGGLYRWAKENGMNSAAGFGGFKKALLAHGIDYNDIKTEKTQEKREKMETAATAEIVLYSDAKASKKRFAICNKNGDPVWHGQFFDNDRDFDGEQSSGELAAAKKAVWLASKVKETLGLDAIRLTLRVDAEWLTWANKVAEGESKKGGKARELGIQAEKLGVVLTVEWVAGAQNPADAYTICHGFKKWTDTNLESLAA